MKKSIEVLRKEIPAKTVGRLVIDYTKSIKKITFKEFIEKCPFKNVTFGMGDGPETDDAKGRDVLYTDYWYSFGCNGHTYSFFVVNKSVMGDNDSFKQTFVYPTKVTSYSSVLD